MATSKQIKIIHTIKGKLGWDDELYRDVLSKYGVKSSTKLSETKAAKLITEMNKAAGNKPAAYYKNKYKGSKRSSDMATPAQLRAIEGMWADVSRKKDPEKRAAALRKFTKRIVKVDDIRFMEQDQVHKIMEALQGMGAMKPEEYLDAVSDENKQTTIGG